MKKLIVCFLLLGGIFGNVLNAQTNEFAKNVVVKKIDNKHNLVFIYIDGYLAEKGVMKNGKREGNWQSFNENGNLVVEASFANGLKNGVWAIYNGNEVKYLIEYQDNKRVKSFDLANLN